MLSKGNVYVSLVAFIFNNTKVLGLPVPWHTKFEEVNLRFYVVPESQPTKRAVTFIKEIVPKPIIPMIANGLFNENYVAFPMSHNIVSNQFEYRWK